MLYIRIGPACQDPCILCLHHSLFLLFLHHGCLFQALLLQMPPTCQYTHQNHTLTESQPAWRQQGAVTQSQDSLSPQCCCKCQSILCHSEWESRRCFQPLLSSWETFIILHILGWIPWRAACFFEQVPLRGPRKIKSGLPVGRSCLCVD